MKVPHNFFIIFVWASIVFAACSNRKQNSTEFNNNNTKEYEEQNGSLAMYVVVGSLKTYLEDSCLWAGVDMIDEFYYNIIASTFILDEEYYDKDGNKLTAVKPHFISSEWHAGT